MEQTDKVHGRRAAGGRHALPVSEQVDRPAPSGRRSATKNPINLPKAPTAAPVIGSILPEIPSPVDTHGLPMVYPASTPGDLTDPANTGPLFYLPQPLPQTRRERFGKKAVVAAVTTGGLLLVGGAATAIPLNNASHTSQLKAIAPKEAVAEKKKRVVAASQRTGKHAKTPDDLKEPDAAKPEPKPAAKVVKPVEKPAPAPKKPAAPAPKPAPPAPVTEVVVQPGDTAGTIAAKYGKDVTVMLAANGITPDATILAGQTLLLDGPSKLPAPAPEPAPVPVETPAPPAPEPQPVAVVTPAPAAPVAPAPKPAPPVAAPAPAPKPAPPAANSNRGQIIVNAALSQVGETQDCVRLVADSLAAVGIFHYKWPVEYYQIGDAVPAAQALPGDLVYYANGGAGVPHIGVYIGNGKAVHGGWFGNQTVVESVNVGSGPQYIRLR